MAVSILHQTKKKVFKFLAKKFSGHVLLYHCCFDDIPEALNHHIHNVKPDDMYEQLSWYKRNYDMVSLQEWVEAKSRSGLATVTFDDAYRCVFREALPVLESLEIPATIFVIAGTLQGKTLWRDRIRIMEALGLTKQFTEKVNREFGTNFSPDTFYVQSKDPIFNLHAPNAGIDEMLRAFLTEHADGILQTNYCVTDESELITHPLLSYGNHSYHHYKFSTLSKAEQQEDLEMSYKIVKEAAGSSFVSYFSLPFGGHDSYNQDTLKILKKQGAEAVLLNNTSLNRSRKLDKREGVFLIERFMVPSTLDELQQKVVSMSHCLFKN